MKKIMHYASMFLLMGMFFLPVRGNAGVRVHVRIGPPAIRTVAVVKPYRPYKRAVWVNGHYVYRGGRYVYVKGYWVKPRPNYVYVQPRWKKTRRGYYFVPGHWVRVR